MQKYFLALMPPPEIADKVHNIKLLIREQFGIKYALKSPPHITVKMPFSYNEAKESLLEEKLGDFLKTQKPFDVKIDGVGAFGNRVIYHGIEKSANLVEFQALLKNFCKKELNLVDELSDRNFYPHLTVAFKDLKPSLFGEVLNLVNQLEFQAKYSAHYLAMLKRIDQKWVLHRRISFGG